MSSSDTANVRIADIEPKEEKHFSAFLEQMLLYVGAIRC